MKFQTILPTSVLGSVGGQGIWEEEIFQFSGTKINRNQLGKSRGDKLITRCLSGLQFKLSFYLIITVFLYPLEESYD